MENVMQAAVLVFLFPTAAAAACAFFVTPAQLKEAFCPGVRLKQGYILVVTDGDQLSLFERWEALLLVLRTRHYSVVLYEDSP